MMFDRATVLVLPLAAAMLGSTPASSGADEGLRQTSSEVRVEHVRIHTNRPYPEIKAELERRLGRLDDHIRSLLARGDVDALRAALEKVSGTDGLVIHYIALHGDWLVLDGGRRDGIVYHIGNVLSAVQMTRRNFGAGLYAPLRMAVFDDGHGTTFEFDRPSTLFGQYHDPEIDAVARSLDDRLFALVRKVGE